MSEFNRWTKEQMKCYEPKSKGRTLSRRAWEDDEDVAEAPIEIKKPMPMKFHEEADAAMSDPLRESGKFRIQNCKLFLTYKTHITKEANEKNPDKDISPWIDWLQDKLKFELDFVRMAHETGDEVCPYEHTHILIRSKVKICTTCARFFDYMGIHPHIRCVRNSADDWKRIKHYMTKEDPDCDNLKAEPSVVSKIFKCLSLEEALLDNVKRPSDALGVKLLFELKPRRPPRDNTLENPTEIQLEWENWCQGEPRYGQPIKWVFDPPGQCGKTTFQKHMRSKYPDECHWISDCSSKSDVATLLSGHFVEKDNEKCKNFFINLERGVEDYKSIYRILEMISDGEVTSSKYKGCSFEIPPQNIIVFANFAPHLDRMSAGRIAGYTILGPVGRTNRGMVPLNMFQIREKKFNMKLSSPEFDKDDDEWL